MEYPDKIELDTKNSMRAKIFIRLFTPESEEFENVDSRLIRETARVDSNIIIPTFDIKVTNTQNTYPSKQIKNIIKSEIDENIAENMNLAKIVSRMNPKDIKKTEPEGLPKTDTIQIAEYIITPNQDGIIGHIKLNNLTEIKNRSGN
jgi:hypothetical protein